MTATDSPVTTGRGLGGVRSQSTRREVEAELLRRFPTMTRSQANKIVRRNRTLAGAITEATSWSLPRCAYRGPDPTVQTAVGNLTREGR